MADDHSGGPVSPARRAVLGAAGLGAAGLGATGIAFSGTALAEERAARPLEGRVALVTGAARGIGRATAIELARRGADVALLDIADPEGVEGVPYRLASRAELDEAASRVAEQGVRALTLVADVRNREGLGVAADRTGDELGGPDLLVANAAIYIPGGPDADDPAAWQAQFAVNLLGVRHSVDACLPALRAAQEGRVVMLSSLTARMGSGAAPGYSASKWGVTGYMKSLALSLGQDGITVNAVAPSGVDTVMLRDGVHAGKDRDEIDAQSEEGHALPVGMLRPEDVAEVIAFLGGPEARRISGATIDVNAGHSARFTA